MKKYSQLIKESNLTKWPFVKKLSDLMEGENRFIVYRFGLFDAINKLLDENSSPLDGNPSSQYPLSLLYETGKYPEIQSTDSGFYSAKISDIKRVINKYGEWDPVNKLNTNYRDLAELSYDLFIKLNVYKDIPTDTDQNLKMWLIDFKEKNDLYSLIKDNIIWRNYTNNIKYLSKIGLESEEKVKSMLVNKGCEILYQGGDGEPVDMVYGIDLIVKKDKIYTVQVKSGEKAAQIAFNRGIKYDKSEYSKIDWFCNPTKTGIKIFTKHYNTGRDINF